MVAGLDFFHLVVLETRVSTSRLGQDGAFKRLYHAVALSLHHGIRQFPSSNQKRFYSVAVITSGSDRHHFGGVGHPGDPGSIPGRTFPFAEYRLAIWLLFQLAVEQTC